MWGEIGRGVTGARGRRRLDSRARALVLLGATALIAVPFGVAHGVTRAAAATTPGANPADCPGGVLQPHAAIVINSHADWTAANGVTGGTGTASDPYVISCLSISLPSSVNNVAAITVNSGGASDPFLIRDVQLTGPGGVRGAGTNNQDGIQLYGVANGDIEQTTVSHLSYGLNGGASTTGRLRLANSLLSNNVEGIGNGSANFTIANNVFTSNVYGIYTAAGPITNNTFSYNGTAFQICCSTLFASNDVENNDNGIHISAGIARGNTIRGNGTGVFTGPCTGCQIDQNLIAANRSVGIDISFSLNAIITNNIIEDNGSAGIEANAPNNPPFDVNATSNVIDGNHIGRNPFGIVFESGNNNGNVVTNTDWTDGHQSVVRFTNQNTIVDAGSTHEGTTDQPVFFHDYIAAVNLGPGPYTPTGGNLCPQLGSCNVGSYPVVQYSAVTGVHWDFGDGQGLDVPTAVATQGQGPEPDVLHAYSSTGTYTAKLTVTAVTTGGRTATFSDTTPVTIISSPATSLLPAPAGHAPWPILGNRPDRTFYNDQTAITKATVGLLVPKWRFPTTEPVTASPAVADVLLPPLSGGAAVPTRVVFDGDFAGTVYAIRDDTGTPAWTHCIYTTTGPAPVCDQATPGNPQATTDYGVIVASPAVATVTLPGGASEQRVFQAGNATVVALDAATGTERWRFVAASSDPTYDIESSPVVIGNAVIFGIDCNQHCVKPGGMYAVDAADGHLLWFFDPANGATFQPSTPTFSFDPTLVGPATANYCGGVWSSPAYDASLGLIFMSSANCNTIPLPPYMEAVFALHVANGTPAWQYQPRINDQRDMDYGATPNVFMLGSEHVVGVGGKDGVYSLFDGATGQVKWTTKLELGGSLGGIFNSATDGTKIYVSNALGEASDVVTPQEESAKGREFALDARTGNVVWRQYAGAPDFGQNGLIPGVYLTGGLDHFVHAWDADTGAHLASFPIGGAVSSTPTVVGSEMFTGAGTGATYRSEFTCNADPLCTAPVQFPHPIPVYEFGQGIYSFCLATDTSCSAAIGAINATKHPTKVTYTGATSGDPDDPATFSATLSDTSGGQSVPVANKSVTFSLSNQSCTGTTDITGTANCSLTLNEAAGAYTVSATFSGDTVYQASNDSKPFTVNHEETTLQYTGDTAMFKGSPANLAVVLKDDSGAAIQNRKVSFSLGTGTSAQTCTGTTSSNGTASCTIASVHQPVGSSTVSASFGGDQFFQPASANAAVTIAPRGGSGGEDRGDGDVNNGHGSNAHFHVDGDAAGQGDDPQDTPGAGNTVSAHDPGNGSPGSSHNFQSAQIQSISFGGGLNSMTITGTGVDNGVPVTFIAQVVDNGTSAPGTFTLVLSDGYIVGGPLLDGTVILQ